MILITSMKSFIQLKIAKQCGKNHISRYTVLQSTYY